MQTKNGFSSWLAHSFALGMFFAPFLHSSDNAETALKSEEKALLGSLDIQRDRSQEFQTVNFFSNKEGKVTLYRVVLDQKGLEMAKNATAGQEVLILGTVSENGKTDPWICVRTYIFVFNVKPKLG